MSKFFDWLSELYDKNADLPNKFLNTAESEAIARALELIFGARPEYAVMEDGKTHYYWIGQNLITAQNRVKEMAKGNPDSTVSIDLAPLITPVVVSKAAPIVGAGILLKMLVGKK